MKKSKAFECYPVSYLLVYNFFVYSLHAVSLYLSYLVHPILFAFMLVLIVYLEYSVLNEGCRNCYYYGKRCIASRGKIAKLLVKKGDPKKFTEKEISAKDFLPSFLPLIITLGAGVYLLLQSFSWFILGLTAWPIVVFMSNQITYGVLACPHCKQAKLGCPVCEFFKKKHK